MQHWRNDCLLLNMDCQWFGLNSCLSICSSHCKCIILICAPQNQIQVLPSCHSVLQWKFYLPAIYTPNKAKRKNMHDNQKKNCESILVFGCWSWGLGLTTTRPSHFLMSWFDMEMPMYTHSLQTRKKCVVMSHWPKLLTWPFVYYQLQLVWIYCS